MMKTKETKKGNKKIPLLKKKKLFLRARIQYKNSEFKTRLRDQNAVDSISEITLRILNTTKKNLIYKNIISKKQ